MSKLKKVWVLSDKPAALAELCHGGGILGEEVLAVVPGARESAEQAVKWGAGRVFWLQEAGRDGTLEDYVPILAERIRQEQPELILIRANARGKLIAGRLAAILATNALTDALTVAVADGQVIVEHRAYGGAAIAPKNACPEQRSLPWGPAYLQGLPKITPEPEPSLR